MGALNPQSIQHRNRINRHIGERIGRFDSQANAIF